MGRKVGDSSAASLAKFLVVRRHCNQTRSAQSDSFSLQHQRCLWALLNTVAIPPSHNLTIFESHFFVLQSEASFPIQKRSSISLPPCFLFDWIFVLFYARLCS